MNQTGPDRVPKILVDARFRAERRGGDRCRFELARHLARLGSNYTFLGYDDTAGALREVSGNCGVVVTSQRPWRHPAGDIYEHIALPITARRMDADIYHGTFNVVPAMWGLRPARRTIVTIHDVAVFKMPEAYSAKFCMLARFLMRRAVQCADQIIAVSTATKNDLAELFPAAAAKTSVILNGVGDELLKAAEMPPHHAHEIIQRLQLPARYVLYVGNLERKKNLPRLIEAFGRAKAAGGLPHRLVIVGKHPDGVPDAGIAAALRDGLAVFTGFLPDADLPAVYRAADLVAYPSLYEGFGMPVLEGLATGIPVITSSISSMPEVAGGAALLVDPHSVEEIAAAIVTGLQDECWRDKAVIRGLEQARALSWERNARQVADVYRNVLNDVPADGVAVGVPARVIKVHEPRT